jgi:hypothetical protein
LRPYGWEPRLSDQEILVRIVALNRQRTAEERDGLVRWIRPEFQAPQGIAKKAQQFEAEFGEAEQVVGKPDFPKIPGEQVAAVRGMLAAIGKPVRVSELARRFKQGKRVEGRVGDLLQIMAAIGQAQTENGSRYFAVR